MPDCRGSGGTCLKCFNGTTPLNQFVLSSYSSCPSALLCAFSDTFCVTVDLPRMLFNVKCQYVALPGVMIFLLYATRYRTVEFRDIPPAAVVRVGLKANCSFDVFRQTAKDTPSGYLRGDGTWTRNSTGQPSRFYPSMCNLQYGVDIPSEKVRLMFPSLVVHGLCYMYFSIVLVFTFCAIKF